MSITSIGRYLPTVHLNDRNVVSKIKILAITALAILALAKIPTASAGCFGDCMTQCMAGGTPAWICGIICGIMPH